MMEYFSMASKIGVVSILVTLLIYLKINTSYAQPNMGQTDCRDLITEADRTKNRIDSFQGWTGKKTPIQLAIAGFRYTGTSDKVVCDTCGLKMFNWRESDNAVQAHKQYSRGCDFIKKWFTDHESVTENHDSEYLPPPAHPIYSTYQQRVDSFCGWPLKHEHQSPSYMARNGFFYIGSADRVCCFQCGLRLRDWDEDDYPSECHKEWSPNCPFINTANERREERSSGVPNNNETTPEKIHEGMDTEDQEGQEVAESQAAAAGVNSPTEGPSVANETEDSRNENREDNNSEPDVGNTASGGVADDQAEQTNKCCSRDGCHVNWGSSKIQAVLEMGCEKELVERVTIEHLRNSGKDFPSAVLLYEAILELESSSI